MNPWGKLSDADDKKFNELFDKYVPACGKADTIGGEILRAIARIVYRYYNDGDTVLRYYGGTYNYLLTANDYLITNVKDYINLRYYTDDLNYEMGLCKNLKTCLDYVVNNPQVFEEENTSDFIEESRCEECKVDYDYEEEDDWEEDYED